jgi:molybdate transport system regulatory protein
VTSPSSTTPKTNRSRTPPRREHAAVWDPHWSVGLRVWVEHRGRAVLGEGRADLLAEIERTHSISAAARGMKMSYRHAWLMVQAVNEAAGVPLVESAVGGVKGGGAKLTERGRAALSLFRKLTTDVRRHAAASLTRVVAAAPQALRVAAAISLQEAVAAVLTEFALVRPTVRVHALYGASNELAQQLADGASFDLLLSGDVEHVKPLATKELAASRAVRRLAANGLAAIVPADSKLTAGTLDELLKSDFRRLALADPACPLGRCTAANLAKWKLDERLRKRILEVDSSRGVPNAVRSGAADVGIAFSSDAAQAAECRVLFPIRTKQAVVEYFGLVTGASRAVDQAAELLEFFTGDEARRCFRRCGLGT